MRRFVLIEVTGDGGYDVIPHTGSGVTLVCQVSAAQCLIAAAEELPAADIAAVRLTDLPAVHRRVGIAERRAGLAATRGEVAAAGSN